MKRRDVLGALGAAAVGAALECEARADHPAPPSRDDLPVGQFHLALCAFHVAKSDPNFQVEAHHFCSRLRDDVHQCIIYDSRAKNAKILGVEYIIGDALYRTLPEAEKAYYHPHTYEVTAGLLMVPGMPEAEEDALMGKLITTWGKTWHTWPDPSTALPMGDPLLMWAFTKEGQVREELVRARDQALNISTPKIKARRKAAGVGDPRNKPEK